MRASPLSPGGNTTLIDGQKAQRKSVFEPENNLFIFPLSAFPCAHSFTRSKALFPLFSDVLFRGVCRARQTRLTFPSVWGVTQPKSWDVLNEVLSGRGEQRGRAFLCFYVFLCVRERRKANLCFSAAFYFSFFLPVSQYVIAKVLQIHNLLSTHSIYSFLLFLGQHNGNFISEHVTFIVIM